MRRMKKALQRLEFFAFWAVASLIRVMPLDMASYLMGKAWRHLAPFNARHKRAISNISLSLPELSAADHQQIIRNMWENLGRVAAESFQLDRLVNDPKRMSWDADDLIRSLDGKGSLMVSLHMGNWEVCVWPMTYAGKKTAGIYQSIKNPYVEAYIRKLREPLYPGGLFPKGPQAVRKLIATVKDDGIAGVLCDLRDKSGVRVPFFGRPAPSTTIPAMIAVRLNAPIIIGRVIRTSGCNFLVEGEFLDVSRTGDKKHDVEETTRRIHAKFEDWVREYPEQWMWGHRRWE